MLALPLQIQPQYEKLFISFHSPPLLMNPNKRGNNCFRYPTSGKPRKKKVFTSITCTSDPHKIRRDRTLDKHIVRQNKTRFVQKLITLLLSKPKHFMPLHILSKCRAFLSLHKPRSILAMVYRYPTIFEVFNIPTPPLPLNATRSLYQTCIGLTPAALELAGRENELKREMSDALADKLQKLLMLALHHRLLLSKLVHLAPDLGLPVNFRSRLCNDYPDRFKVVETSYGRALELVKWDPGLANVLPKCEVGIDMIVDRPLKFKHVRLRKGMNIKRRHQEFLIMFNDLPDVCPYTTRVHDLRKESLEAEKRACALVRELLGMTVEKRTLVDHVTHFRKEFGLPNKLRGMVVRHPDLFYVSLKGQRDSVFLVEGYDDRGVLLQKDRTLEIRYQVMKLVNEGKKMRREKRLSVRNGPVPNINTYCDSDDEVDEDIDNCDDNLEDLFEYEDADLENAESYYRATELSQMQGERIFWTTDRISFPKSSVESPEPW